MEYKRTTIDGSALLFGLPEEMKKDIQFSKLPELPMLTFKKNKTTYKITDIRYLNENAINALQVILNAIAQDSEEIEEVNFKIQKGTKEETVDLITDILMAINLEVKTVGKNSCSCSGALLIIGSTITKEDDGDDIISYRLIKPSAKIIHDCIKENGCMSWFDIAVAVGNSRIEETKEFYQAIRKGELK